MKRGFNPAVWFQRLFAGPADPDKHGTVFFLEDGVELVDSVREGTVRVVIFRDTRDGITHWYNLEFLRKNGWELIFRVGDKKIDEAIGLLTRAKNVANGKADDPPSR